jgi:hypothetical protein
MTTKLELDHDHGGPIYPANSRTCSCGHPVVDHHARPCGFRGRCFFWVSAAGASGEQCRCNRYQPRLG